MDMSMDMDMDLAGFSLGFVAVGCALAVSGAVLRQTYLVAIGHLLRVFKAMRARCWKMSFADYWTSSLPSFFFSSTSTSTSTTTTTVKPKDIVPSLRKMAVQHQTADVLVNMIDRDGAGSWPPRCNHAHRSWPEAIRPYGDIYLELAGLLPSEKPSLDDTVNMAKIANFRQNFRKLLNERVNLEQVAALFDAAEAGRWDVFPRDAFNAFYCCIASSRHAYRWATIPVVRAAQQETQLNLPEELVLPWTYLQRNYGCTSNSGNNTSNLVHNFDVQGRYIWRINTGMPEHIVKSEEAFAKIFHEVEVLALPVYHAIVSAVIAFARKDGPACAAHVSFINQHIKGPLHSYYDRVHNQVIKHNAWLSYVQGFYAWGLRYEDPATGEMVQHDGLSGNQALLFQALDAFLGIAPYLTPEAKLGNVPARQRAFAAVVQKHSFRKNLHELGDHESEERIHKDFGEIIKKLRVFRAAHRTRAHTYLSQPAPERLPMTAGKSLLKSDISTSLDFLDEFMIGRLAQTV